MFDAICTDVDADLPEACQNDSQTLSQHAKTRGSNREMEEEGQDEQRGEFTYHTRAERRELSAALHERETEEKQPPRHPQ